MAEWLGSGLQNHLHRFESGSDLIFIDKKLITQKKQPEQVFLKVINKKLTIPLVFHHFILKLKA